MSETMPPAHDQSNAPTPVRCKADRDGDCYWSRCPQKWDYEPGRHCPIDVDYDDWGDADPRHVARRDAYLDAHPTLGGNA